MICFFFFAACGSGPRPCGLLCATIPTVSRLAQLVERKTLNLVVVGSSPTVGVSLLPFVFSPFFAGFWLQIGLFFCDGGTRSLGDKLLWRSWQRVGLIIPRSPVRSWSGAFASIAQSGRACA